MNIACLLLAQSTGEEGAEPKADEKGEFETNPENIIERLDNMWDGFLTLLPQIAIGVVVFVIFLFAAGWIRKLILSKTKTRDNANLGRALGRLSQFALVLAGLMVAVAIIAPSVSPADLLATLGIGGVAIGFAFKDILQNFLSGILLLLREPFKLGDQIKSGDFEGTVEAIETRATIIKTFDGKRVVIPNSQIYTAPVVVNTAYENRRSQYDVGIGCGDDIGQAVSVLLDTMKNTEGVVSEPAPDIIVNELADSSVNVRCRWWTASDQASMMKTRGRVITNIKNALDDAAIDMPYPTQVHLFHDQTEEVDGDRSRQREGWPSSKDGKDPKPARRTREMSSSHDS